MVKGPASEKRMAQVVALLATLPVFPPASDDTALAGTGDGSEYAEGPIQVSGSDPYDLDYEDDGIACEEG